ncbi:MAG: preprotein translocase subunit YajC [Pseudomonadota bacterium]
MRVLKAALLVGLAAVAVAAPAAAQDQGDRDGPAVAVQPYIEVSQILSAELSPGNDVVTFTQVAAGVDLNAQGRNSGASVSLRYERNIGYGDDSVDTDTVSGVARGYLSIVPQALTLEAGALASRTRVDSGGGVSPNPQIAEDAESQIYSVYAGPSLATRVGAVDVTGVARVGYNRFETDNAIVDSDGNAVDVFDESTTYTGQIRAGTRAGDALPVGVGVTAGAFQEDISNLDQRVRDLYVRGDVTVPLSDNFAVVGGVGYEDVEVSSRDALRDVDGNPVLDNAGRFVTDSSSPRQIAFDVDGLIWDVGVVWNPSSRTSLAATVGRRYDSTTYYGSFSYVPDSRSALNISVYDGVTGLGGALNNSLADLSSDFDAIRNPLTGDFGGLVTGEDGSGVIGNIGTIRSAAFRGRGVNASYQRRIGQATAAIGAGYAEREFIGAEGTILAALDGITDENYYVNAALTRPIGRNASFATNAYVNWFKSGGDNADVTAVGASAAYNRSITSKLSARAALAVDYFDSEFTAEDFAFATALLGLRYDF